MDPGKKIAVEATNKAIWDDAQLVYRCGAWVSECGDIWRVSGTPDAPSGREWDRAHILLVGGPRDGVMVG